MLFSKAIQDNIRVYQQLFGSKTANSKNVSLENITTMGIKPRSIDNLNTFKGNSSQLFNNEYVESMEKILTNTIFSEKNRKLSTDLSTNVDNSSTFSSKTPFINSPDSLKVDNSVEDFFSQPISYGYEPIFPQSENFSEISLPQNQIATTLSTIDVQLLSDALETDKRRYCMDKLQEF